MTPRRGGWISSGCRHRLRGKWSWRASPSPRTDRLCSQRRPPAPSPRKNLSHCDRRLASGRLGRTRRRTDQIDLRAFSTFSFLHFPRNSSPFRRIRGNHVSKFFLPTDCIRRFNTLYLHAALDEFFLRVASERFG